VSGYWESNTDFCRPIAFFVTARIVDRTGSKNISWIFVNSARKSG
jgi:hypothetical protein